MKVNLHILEWDLQGHDLQGELFSNPYDCNIAFATTRIDGTALHPDRLYVLCSEDLPQIKERLVPRANIICLGAPPSACFFAGAPRIDMLWTDSASSPEEVADEANAAIARYSEWMDDLSALFATNRPLRKAAERSESVFENPIWMWDAQLQTVFHVVTDDSYQLPEQYKMHFDGAPWPIAEVNSIDDAFREALNDHEPYTLPAMFGYESLCYNLFDHDTYIATIAVDNVTGRPMTMRDKILLKRFGDELFYALKYEVHFSKHATYFVNECLERLLSGEAVPTSDLQSALSKMNWKLDDSYFCVLAHQSNATNYPDVFLIPTAEQLNDAFPHIIFSIIDGSILFVANLSNSGLRPDDICDPLANALEKKKLNMKVGASTLFSNFSQVRYFFNQAHDAIHIGEAQHPEQRVFMFHDYILDAVIDRCTSGTVPETLFPPGLSRLIRYDKDQDGDLVKTLREYLRSGMSMKKTSESLYMHRNTLLTRLKTIESVGMLVLDDPDTRMELSIAFLISDARG